MWNMEQAVCSSEGVSGRSTVLEDQVLFRETKLVGNDLEVLVTA